jgi:hypothetical protein
MQRDTEIEKSLKMSDLDACSWEAVTIYQPFLSDVCRSVAPASEHVALAWRQPQVYITVAFSASLTGMATDV